MKIKVTPTVKILKLKISKKNLIEKGVKESLGVKKVHFYNTFNVKVDLCIAIAHNVHGLMEELGIPTYNATDWRLFTDSSKRSLKCVLFHNGNLFGAVPIGYSVSLREEYEDIKRAIDLLQYNMHKWIIVLTLKWFASFLASNAVYQVSLFFVYVDSRAREKHWSNWSNWPPRSNLKPDDPNILHQQLVDRNNIICPPLYIKLSLMKQYIKAFPTEGDCFKYLITAFPILSFEKIKATVCPQIWQLVKDEHFIETMIELQKMLVWHSTIL